jgi:hypothetical protein
MRAIYHGRPLEIGRLGPGRYLIEGRTVTRSGRRWVIDYFGQQETTPTLAEAKERISRALDHDR